jgi:hypothetical protein
MRPRGRLAGVPVMNNARRQQYRRLLHAGGAGAGGAAALVLALAFARAGAISLAAVLLLAAVGFGFTTRHWLRLAGRSRVGARSEDEVHRQLAALERDGWRMWHSLRLRGPGDIDSVAIAPSGIARSRSRRRRGHMTSATSLGCGIRRHGCGAAGEGGAGAARCPSCASCALGAFDDGSRGRSSCRSTG